MPTPLEFLKTHAVRGKTLPELVDVFEEMCRIPIENDALLFETGTFDFTGEKQFNLSLVRQYPQKAGDEFCQLHMDVIFPADETNARFRGNFWSEDVEGDFFRCVRSSRAYLAMQDVMPMKTDVYLDET